MIIFNTYFIVLIAFLFRYLIFLLQVIMVATRNSRSFIPSVTTRKVGAKIVKQKIYFHIYGVILVQNRVIAR